VFLIRPDDPTTNRIDDPTTDLLITPTKPWL
jgi:hypothetical protein